MPDSIDIDHVPTPDPANYNWLTIDQTKIVSADEACWLTLRKIDFEQQRVYIQFHYQDKDFFDFLNLNKPVNALHDQITGFPVLTFVLRELDSENQRAGFQISASAVLFGQRRIQ